MIKFFILLALVAATSSAHASRQSVVGDYWCSKRDTYFNPFKIASIRSCAKDRAVQEAQERCSAMGGYIAKTKVNVSCEFYGGDNYHCDAVANVTCEL